MKISEVNPVTFKILGQCLRGLLGPLIIALKQYMFSRTNFIIVYKSLRLGRPGSKFIGFVQE